MPSIGIQLLTKLGVRLLIAVLMLIAAGVVYLVAQAGRYERDRTELEWTSLSRTLSVLETGPVPDRWSAGVFVSEDGINKLIKGLEGTRISFDPQSSDDEDTEILLRSLALKMEPGFAVGDISIAASSERRSVSVDFVGQASLSFREISTVDGIPNAVFAVQLLSLEPDIRWYSLGLSVRGYAKELLAAGTVTYLSEKLQIRVPLIPALAIDLGVEKELLLPTREPKDENFVVLGISMPPKTIRKKIDFSHPLFLEGGVWLLGNAGDAQSELKFPDLGGRATNQLEDEIKEMRAQVEMLATPAEGDISVWIRGQPVTDMLREINELQEANRTATIRTVRYKGFLSKVSWYDDVLGNGGAYVELIGGSAVSGTVRVSGLSLDWVPNVGVKFAGTLVTDTKVDIHAHVDPLVGGGAGTSVGMLGSGGVALDGSMGASVVDIEGHKVLAIRPSLSCKPFDFSAKTDSKLKMGGGWASVPSVGIVVKGELGASSLPEQLLLSDLPFVISGRSEDGKPVVMEADGKKVQIEPTWASASVGIVPSVTVTHKDGISLAGALNVVYSDTHPEAYDRRGEEEKLRKGLAAGTGAALCGNPSVAVTIGAIEIGKNNDLVRFLKEISPAKLAEWAANPAESFRRGEVGRTLEKIRKEVSPEKLEEWREKPLDSLRRGEAGRIVCGIFGC
ncbi:hypothetical protein CN221_27395 [Sinorhizobium meliloti]|uniref:hypothetical protein n=1 Tax=Rhizobium meliloti TaxID=382 RepID=UPI000FE09631|nr:hypothetical protein [Sinorhizobium meliloti]RVG88463.1 hypothetical protein CN221_27395 [Sinorhizobium meliloti]RVH60026.1 hypothetical protein CN209_25575 [Sinorhizobium meliloti]